MFSIIPIVAAQGVQGNYTEAYTFTTIAGQSPSGSADGAGSLAQFYTPEGVAVDGAGNVYVADFGNSTIRKITPAGGVSTIAGFVGTPGAADGTNSFARFYHPSSVAVDLNTNIYVADTYNNMIRKITPTGSNWVVTTLAGQTNAGSLDGTGSKAKFDQPFGVAVDMNGNVYVADYNNSTIRMVTPAGVVSTIAGSAENYGTNDGTNGFAQFLYPSGVAVDNATNLYVADTFNDTIRMITPAGTNWVVTTIAGVADSPGFADGPGTNALFDFPSAVALDTADNLYVADYNNSTIRMVTPMNSGGGESWTVSTVAGAPGNPGLKDATGTNAQFDGPEGVAVDDNGNIYVGDSVNNSIRKITSADVVSTMAGSGAVSQGSMNGTGSDAQFFGPEGVAADGAGNLYVADTGNNTIRKITSLAVVSTIAGKAGESGTNDGPGSEAQFNGPIGSAADSAGNVYVADSGNNTIRKITPAGVVSTIAGLAGSSGTNDGTGTNALFDAPAGVAVDSATNLYVADLGNNTVRMITPAGVVSTIAGLAGSSGTNDGTGTNALFDGPAGVAVDNATNLYVTDRNSDLIRMITPTGIVSTIAGQAYAPGYEDGISTNAQFNYPWGVAVDASSKIYVADKGNSVIRMITPEGVVSTIGGLAMEPGSSDGAGMDASFNYPNGIAADGAGDVFVADAGNNIIRKGTFQAYMPANAALFVQPSNNATLVVTLYPARANGQWRFPSEEFWRPSGSSATHLAPGEYPIEFSTAPGYLILPLVSIANNGTVTNTVAVTNGATTFVTNTYYPTLTAVDTNNGGGSLTINIGPSPPGAARWYFLGDTNDLYLPGYSTNLAAGTYLIGFTPVAGFTTPLDLSVQIQPGLPTVWTITYLLASSLPTGVDLPMPVAYTNITNLAEYPYGFNGQLETDVGFGSGVAVQPNVVLTAAHLVFNDQTLSYVSGAYWFFREEAGDYEPEPQAAQGWLVLSGYASARTNDVLGGSGPDQSSPESRNFDVAALFFPSTVAAGGYGGYLPSDAAPNTWLTSTAEKMLVGYPVDGSQFGVAGIINGQMYEVGPQPYPLSLATDPVKEQQEVYTASWFLSYPGNSGAPFYVELNGYFYPAGVYLGTLFSGTTPYASVIRAIDGNVVNIITNAQLFVTTGTNNSGGGVVNVTAGSGILGNPAAVEVTITPPAAFQAGAAWKFSTLPDTFYSTQNPSTLTVNSTNPMQLQFKPVAGWNLPSNQSVTVVPGQISTLTAVYNAINPVQVAAGALEVLTNGLGRITSPDGATNNAPLKAGQSYTIRASVLPGRNWLFSNWSGGTNLAYLSVLSTNPVLSFTMSNNLILEANFVTNPFTAVAGVYNGLFYPSNGVTEESSGFFTATLPASGRGAYSAKILLEGASYPFSGSFNLTGLAEKTVARAGKTPVTVNLQIDLSGTNDQMTGSVSNGAEGWFSTLAGERAAFNTRLNPATNYAGKYTLIVPPASNAPVSSPGGYGEAALTATLAGNVSLAGYLGDGKAFNQSVPVSKNGNIPLYASLYSRQGLLLGWLSLTNNPTNQPPQTLLGTNLSWIKLSSGSGTSYANGFTNTNITVLGSHYVPPSSGADILFLTNGTLTISNGDLASALVYSNLSIAGSKLSNDDPGNPTNKLAVAINPANGTMTVTFRPTGSGRNTVGRGVVLQNGTNAAGWFLGTNQSGYFLLR